MNRLANDFSVASRTIRKAIMHNLGLVSFARTPRHLLERARKPGDSRGARKSSHGSRQRGEL
uniref:Uncharacterized protein n=1 Tax=Lepeophtheirus salmonis TaxID=72036 RepID=A0A0K2TQ93_LEPSM